VDNNADKQSNEELKAANNAPTFTHRPTNTRHFSAKHTNKSSTIQIQSGQGLM
jgi:hypothetical protein